MIILSYAIIRNQRYTSGNLNYIYRHNERKNTNYSNSDINRQNSINNYSIKSCNTTYLNKFNQLKEQYDLKGQIKKTSNIACEYIITSDDSIGENETKRFFETAYKFVANYKNLGEEFILSAKVHMDEKTPHMHLVFIPVIHTLDSKGQAINKVACSEFWKGKNSYKILQDNFYTYRTRSGFDLERGKDSIEREHLKVQEFKDVTKYEVHEMFEDSKHLETEVITNDINVMRENYKRVIKKFNTIAKRYIRINNIVEETLQKNQDLYEDNCDLVKENQELERENIFLREYLDKTKTWISAMLDWSIDRVERALNDFYEKFIK